MIPAAWRKPLLWGTLAVGALDILDALIFFGLRGVAPPRILQSIAAMPTASLVNGILVHMVGVGIPAALAAQAALRNHARGSYRDASVSIDR